jgi:hypothetical protein
LLFLWVLELSPCLSYQFLTATAHKDWTAAVLRLTLCSTSCRLCATSVNIHSSSSLYCMSLTVVVWLLISQSLTSNGSTCDIAPSIRLLVPNSLQVYRHFSFPEGCARNVCDWPRLPSPWLGSFDDYSPTAPSFRPLVQSGSLIRCAPSRCTTIIFDLFRGAAGKGSESDRCSYFTGSLT